MSGQDKVAPDAQGMVLSNLICNADAIIRLKRTMLPLQIGETIYPAGTRQLLIAEGPSSVDCAIGGRAWPPLPEYILEPTLEKFIAAYHGTLAHNIVLYGAPKVGKTTFATGADRYKQLAT